MIVNKELISILNLISKAEGGTYLPTIPDVWNALEADKYVIGFDIEKCKNGKYGRVMKNVFHLKKGEVLNSYVFNPNETHIPHQIHPHQIFQANYNFLKEFISCWLEDDFDGFVVWDEYIAFSSITN